jgi:antirestriction protein ArdC
MVKKQEHEDPREKHGKLLIEKIEASLQGGSPIVPWRSTWDPAMNPRNVRGNMYRGGNLLMTLFATMMSGYSSPFFLTFNQAIEHGGIVKPSESGWRVIYWKWWGKEDKDSDGNEDAPDSKSNSFRRATAFGYTVFNIDQCKLIEDEDRERMASRPGGEAKLAKAGSPEKWASLLKDLKKKSAASKRRLSPVKAAEKIHKGYKKAPKILHGSAFSPCYIKNTDVIQLPEMNQFHSAVEYHLTRFHEEVHSTGHDSRLARQTMYDMKHRGDHMYSREELTAEFGASMLASVCGIEQGTVDNTVAYLQSWLKALKNDPKMLYSAAQDAQKATDLILGIEMKKEEQK